MNDELEPTRTVRRQSFFSSLLVATLLAAHGGAQKEAESRQDRITTGNTPPGLANPPDVPYVIIPIEATSPRPERPTPGNSYLLSEYYRATGRDTQVVIWEYG